MIQSSTRNSILRINGGFNLVQADTLNYGLIQFSRNEASQLHVPVSLFCDNKGQGESLSHRCSTLVLKGVFVVVAATVYQEPHFWTKLRTEGQELNVFLFLTKKGIFPFQSIATRDLS